MTWMSLPVLLYLLMMVRDLSNLNLTQLQEVKGLVCRDLDNIEISPEQFPLDMFHIAMHSTCYKRSIPSQPASCMVKYMFW